jgi:hypothetical protein
MLKHKNAFFYNMSRMANTLLSSPEGTWACIGNGLLFAVDADAEAEAYVEGACFRVASAVLVAVVVGEAYEVAAGGRGGCESSTASSIASDEENLGLDSAGLSVDAPP